MLRVKVLIVVAIMLPLTLPVITWSVKSLKVEEGFSVEVEATRVYGLNVVRLPVWMNYSKIAVTGDSIVLAGSGYVTELLLENLTLRWTHSIVGKATALSIDSKPARWVSIGTSAGEGVVVDLAKPFYKISFYTASRAPVKDIFIVETKGGFKLVILDEAGFLYVMRVIRGPIGGGWFEIGPVPHAGALIGLYGLKVTSVHPTVFLVDWSSFKLLGNMVVAVTDITLPYSDSRSRFLGNFIVDVLYKGDGFITPAYTGSFNISLGLVEIRSLYYAVKHGSYLVPISTNSIGGNLYIAGNSTIKVEGLPPGSYEVLAFYEVKIVEKLTGRVISSSCYTGSSMVRVTSGYTIKGKPLVLERVGERLEECFKSVKLNDYHVVEAMQVLLLLDLTRLPESFDYGVDGNVVLLPIPRELLSTGISSLKSSDITTLAKPGLGTPMGWDDLGVEVVLLIPVREWLLVYFLGKNLNLVDVGYMQPQTIYFGSMVTAVNISPDASRIYVGLESGSIFKLEWLRAKPWLGLGGVYTNRYFMESSLEIGEGLITYVGELSRDIIVASNARGRLQVIRFDDTLASLTPLWRGPPGFEGVDTGFSNIVFTVGASDTLIAYSQGSRELYLFKGDLAELNPLIVNIIPISFRDDGSWFISPSPPDLKVLVEDRRGAVIAVDSKPRGKATLYLPRGSYNITLKSSWGVASVDLIVTPGFNEGTLVLVQEPGGRAYAELLREGVTIDDIIRRRPPRANIDIRFIDVDGNPVMSRLRVTIEGQGYRSSIIVSGGLAKFENIPLGTYRVLVEPLEGLYDKLETQVKVTVRGLEPRVLELKPSITTVTLKILDKQFKTIASEPFLVKLERLETGSLKLVYAREVRVVGQAKLELPIGTYRAKLIPAGRDLYQIPSEVRFMVEKPGDVVIELQPKVFILTIQAKDIWGSPIAGARVTITRSDGLLSLEGETDQNGILSIAVPHGAYEIRISKRWFKEAITIIDILGDETTNITVEPGIVIHLYRLSPYIVALSGVLVASTIILWARRVVVEKLKEEYF